MRAASVIDRWSWAHGPGLAIAMLTSVILGGTVGYVVIEGWSFWDGFYMTVTTVATVGFREVHPLSFAGQVFTLLLIFGGVGTAIYTATLLAAVLVEGGLSRRLEQRRMMRMLERITNHFILCGFGRIGGVIAEELAQQHTPFVVMDRDPERARAATNRGWIGLEADASHEDALKTAGIERARGLIAAVGTDAENVYTVLSARVLRPDLYIVARVESDEAAIKLQRAGADRVISPYQIGAAHIVQSALRPAVVDFVQLATRSGHLDLSMEQVGVRQQSKLAGRTILEAGIRQNFGVIVVAVRRKNGEMEFNPAPETAIQAGDELVVLGRPDNVRALEEAARI